MKKHALILCLILILAFSVSCAPSQKESAPVPKSEAKVQAGESGTAAKQQIPAEVKELLDKSKTKVKNIYYKYRAPQTGSNYYEFYAKENKIKYKPYLEIKTLDQPDSYDSVFIDKTAKTAKSYCEAAYCQYKGKKADLSYEDAYMPTIFDWIEGLTEAKKIGEEVIEERSTWKLETSKGVLWIDTFYGIPLKAESNGNVYKFQQISVNSVQDSDVIPS